MPVHKFSQVAFENAYGISCKSVFNYDPTKQPIGSTICRVDPLGSSKFHSHHETEVFWVFSGGGTILIDDELTQVVAGDVIVLPAFSNHILTNTSDSEPLDFLSTYWENPGRIFHFRKPSRALVFSAPPTPNGPLHLGHISGPYLAADVVTRFLKSQNVDAHYISGTDDHQSYVVTKALKLQQPVAETVDKFAYSISHSLEAFSAAPEVFIRPMHDHKQKQFVKDFFQKLNATNWIQIEEKISPYCEICQRQLFEAFVNGNCPHCSKPTGGNSCEGCGLPNDGLDLKNITCSICGNEAAMKTQSRYYFPLEKMRTKLLAYHDHTTMPQSMRSYLDRILQKPLPHFPVAHFADWGIALDKHLNHSLVALAWFEMAATYLYEAGLVEGENWQEFWKDPKCAVIQCFGFDNSYFYLIVLPALMLAYDEQIILPQHFLINQFYQLDGKKFSTSRGHAVWADEILKFVSSDVVRLYLARTRPEIRETNFSLVELERFVSEVLVNQWDRLFHRANSMANDRQIPPMPKQEKILEIGALSAPLRCFVIDMTHFCNSIALHLSPSAFSLNQAAGVLTSGIERMHLFVDEMCLDSSDALSSSDQVIAQELFFNELRNWVLYLAPIMPILSANLLSSFAEKNLKRFRENIFQKDLAGMKSLRLSRTKRSEIVEGNYHEPTQTL